MNYYNEFDPYASEWLKNLIKEGFIPNGEVDTRSIVDVEPNDLKRFTQCHFFAGIAGWSLALKLAGWADDRQIWTGSCPCQPFSVAGKGKGKDDERHLWPHFFRLISACRPNVVMGEQVAGKAGYDWLDGVRADLEGQDYACTGVDIPACAVNAPHIRQRLYWVAYADSKSIRGRLSREIAGSPGRNEGETQEWQWFRADASSDGQHSGMGDADGSMFKTRAGYGLGVGETRISGRASAYSGDTCGLVNANGAGQREYGWPVSVQAEQSGTECAGRNSFWREIEWLTGADGKARRVKPGICLLANGVPARVGKLRAFGNAIVPELAEQVIRSFMEVHGEQSRTQAKDW